MKRLIFDRPKRGQFFAYQSGGPPLSLSPSQIYGREEAWRASHIPNLERIYQFIGNRKGGVSNEFSHIYASFSLF